MTYFLVLLCSQEWKACLLAALQMKKALYMHERAHMVCVCVCVCVNSLAFAPLEEINRTSGNTETSSPKPRVQGRREEPQSVVARPEMEIAWVMDQLWVWGDPEPPWIHVSHFQQMTSTNSL